jgi:hypothetical protein
MGMGVQPSLHEVGRVYVIHRGRQNPESLVLAQQVFQDRLCLIGGQAGRCLRGEGGDRGQTAGVIVLEEKPLPWAIKENPVARLSAKANLAEEMTIPSPPAVQDMGEPIGGKPDCQGQGKQESRPSPGPAKAEDHSRWKTQRPCQKRKQEEYISLGRGAGQLIGQDQRQGQGTDQPEGLCPCSPDGGQDNSQGCQEQKGVEDGEWRPDLLTEDKETEQLSDGWHRWDLQEKPESLRTGLEARGCHQPGNAREGQGRVKRKPCQQRPPAAKQQKHQHLD